MLLVANLAYTKWCQNPEKWPNPWHMGTHLRVRSESYPMNTNMIGFRWLSKIFASLCFGQKEPQHLQPRCTCGATTSNITYHNIAHEWYKKNILRWIVDLFTYGPTKKALWSGNFSENIWKKCYFWKDISSCWNRPTTVPEIFCTFLFNSKVIFRSMICPCDRDLQA